MTQTILDSDGGVRSRPSGVCAALACATLAFAASAAAPLAAQPAVSAPIDSVHYDVTFTAATARQRAFDVTMSFRVAGRSDVLLSLPAWTPGAYEISNFARNIVRFDAAQGGAPVRWEKEDHDTWRIHPSGPGRVSVSFRYRADTLDNSGAWARDDFLLFNGTTAFMYPEGASTRWPATVTVRTDDGWQVVTAMPSVRPAPANTFAERDYHDLVDHPFFIGPLDVDSATVSGRWLRFATYPRGAVSGELRRRMWSALERMIPVQAAVFGGTVPWPAYTVMQIADSSYGGASGLEHRDSHVDIVAWRALDNPFVLSLYAHEIFHAWNVKRLRPAELTPYRYDAPQPTPLLWVAEGITDYYADLSLVRGGIATAREFLTTTETKISNVAALPATSLEDASLSTWVAPRDGTHYVYYDHGSLAGLLLDVLIRDATDNRASLDDVMRRLYATVAAERGDRCDPCHGFTNEDFWRVVEETAGRSLADFRARYVDGRERLPYSAVLPLAGIRVREDSVQIRRVGVSTAEDSIGVLVVEVQPGSSAAEAGVRAGDYLLFVGDVPVTGTDFGARFRQRYASTPAGAPLAIRVRRAGREQTLTAPLRVETVVTYRLSVDTTPREKAGRIWRSLISGR